MPTATLRNITVNIKNIYVLNYAIPYYTINKSFLNTSVDVRLEQVTQWILHIMVLYLTYSCYSSKQHIVATYPASLPAAWE